MPNRHVAGPTLIVSCALYLLCWAAPAGPSAEQAEGEPSAREKRLLEREGEKENLQAELHWTNAESAFLVNDLETARKGYLGILGQYPTSDYALRSLARVGDVYRREKSYPQAIDFYRKAIAHYAQLGPEQKEKLRDEMIRARYMIGATCYDQKNYPRAFGELRGFTQDFPDSQYANAAYFLIGQAHLASNNVRAALDAFESVGTAKGDVAKDARTLISPGDTLYVQVSDPDLRTSAAGQLLKVQVTTTRGDVESVLLAPQGLGSDVYVGKITTQLGTPQPTAPLENLWSPAVDVDLEVAMRKGLELDKRATELKREREAAKIEMERIARDKTLTGQQQLEAVEKQKKVVEELTNRIVDLTRRAGTERQAAFERLDEIYGGTETFLRDRAPDQTIEGTKVRLEKQAQQLARESAEVEQETEGEADEDEGEQKLKETFSEEEILNERLSVAQQPTDEGSFERRRALLRFWVDRLLHDLKRVDLVGTDEISVLYKDEHVASGQGPAVCKDTIGVASDGFVGFVGDDVSTLVDKAIYSSAVRVQVVDADRDVSDGRDIVTVAVSVVPSAKPKEPEGTSEEWEGTTGDEGAPDRPETSGGRPGYIETYVAEPQYKVVESTAAEGGAEKVVTEVEAEQCPPLVPEGAANASVRLLETGPHTGVFVDTLAGTPQGVKAAEAVLLVSPEERLRAAYEDERSLARDKPWVVWSLLEFVPGSAGEVEVPDVQDTRLNRRAQPEKGISEAELARVYEDLGLDDKARLYYEKALRTCAAIAKLEGLTPLGEEATHAIWRIYFESGQTEKAIAACRQLIREFPDSRLVDEAYLVMGQALLKKAQEAGDHEAPGYAREAIGHFSGLVRARPDSEYVAEALYSTGLCLFLSGSSGTEYMERVAKEYPESAFASLALVQSGIYAYKRGDFASAYEYFTRVATDYPDAEERAKVLFYRGHCKVKMKQYPDALRAYYELLESYPGSPYARQAQQIVDYLKKSMASTETE